MLGSVCNGGSRFIWASMQDCLGFKKVYGIILAIQIFACSNIYSQRNNANLYVAIVCFSFLAEGGHFSIFPAVCAKVFGNKNGGQICSILFWFASLSALSGFILLQVQKEVNYQLVFYIALGMTVFNCVTLFFFDESPMQKTKDPKQVVEHELTVPNLMK